MFLSMFCRCRSSIRAFRDEICSLSFLSAKKRSRCSRERNLREFQWFYYTNAFMLMFLFKFLGFLFELVSLHFELLVLALHQYSEFSIVQTSSTTLCPWKQSNSFVSSTLGCVAFEPSSNVCTTESARMMKHAFFM